MPASFPNLFDAPAKLWAVDGNCGLLAAWCVIKHYRRRTSADRLIRACGHTRRYGVFTIALATALREHGLDVTFHSQPDSDVKPLEQKFYRRAQDLQIPVLHPVSLPELLLHTSAGHVPIVFFDTPSGQGHFSPLLGERRGRLILPHSNSGDMSRKVFSTYWNAREVLRQCVIIKGPRKR